MNSTDWQSELEGLTETLCEGEFTSAERTRFNELLREHPEARQHFRDFMQLHSALELRIGDPQQMMASLAESIDAEESAAEPYPSIQVPPPAGHRRFSMATRHLVVGVAIGIMFVAMSLSIMHQILLPVRVAEKNEDKKRPPESPQRIESIARLVNDVDAKWQGYVENPTVERKQQIKTGMKLYPGQKLKLVSGAAEFKFFNGAEVTLEGPAEFEVQGKKHCGLASGKLVVVAPVERAKGFVVETPTARIEDLGTEFGVYVANGGRTVVQVFDGSVSVDVRGSDLPVRELAVDEAIAVVPSGTGARFADAVVADHSFVRATPEGMLVSARHYRRTQHTDTFTPQLNGIEAASDDLVQAGADTLEAANAIQFLENSNLDFANINDGVSEAMGDGVFESESNDGAEWIAEFVLNTAKNTEGYDIKHIDSIASWTRGRIQQRVTVSYSTVDAPETFSYLLGTFTNIGNVAQTTGASRIRIADEAEKVLASRVKAIRLRYTNHGLGSNYLPVVQEVDVIGSPTSSSDQGDAESTPKKNQEAGQIREDSPVD